MTQRQYIITRKLNILELGATLGNISAACRKLGVSRQHYYDIREALAEDGLEGLLEKTRALPRIGNRIAPEIEEKVLGYSLQNPTHGQTRTANELAKQGVVISAGGVRGVWLRHKIETKGLRLKRLEKWAAENMGILTESQVQALESAKEEREAHGEVGNLIERPDYVIKHFLIQKMGFALADIDTASFNSAGTFYNTNTYKLAFVIDEKITPSEFVKRLAFECRSTLSYRKGKWYLNVIPNAAPSSVKTVASDELAGEYAKFTFSKTPITDIANDLTAKFKRAYTKMGSESDWLGTSKVSDSASKTKYGTYPKDFEFNAVRLQAMADNVLAHILKQRKRPYLIVEFPVFWEHFDLKAGDTIEIDNPLYDGRKFYIEEIRRENKGKATVKAVEWW